MDERMNVLLIVVHDLGTRVGCYGETSVQTPALDGLAETGARFSQQFGTATYCSPSRGSIVTGKYPHVNGLMGLVNLGWDLPAHNCTLAKCLGEAGHETFLFGLQHEVKDAAVLGFQHVDPEKSRACDAVSARVVEFLRQRGPDDGPFYARVGFSEVHRVYDHYEPDDPAQVNVPAFLKDTPGAREDLAMFHGSIRTMDRAVGRILSALDESGLADRTLVIFTTDHGMAFPRCKATVYDGGIRTTLLMRCLGVIPAGQVVSDLVSNVDVFPTVLDAAGAPAPTDIQGRSLWPLLTGQPYTPRDAIFAEKNTTPGDAKRCVRTGRFKYIRNYDEGPMLALPTDIERSLTRRDMGDEHLEPRPPVELYDLASDPHELHNLAGQPEWADTERELAERLDAIMAETADPLLRGPVPRPPAEAAIYEEIWRKTREVLRQRES